MNREIIDASRLPENLRDLPEYLRLLKRWLAVSQPHTVFDCEKITVSMEDK